MSEELVKSVLRRDAELMKEHVLWEPLWQEISELVIPNKSDISIRTSPGSLKTRRLFDSTALESNERLAASISGTVTSPVIEWFSIDLPPMMGFQRPKIVDEWLQGVRTTIFRHLSQSNFYAEVNECFQDIAAFGTCSMFIEEKKKPGRAFGGLQFRSLHVSEYVIGEDADGMVNVLDRSLEVSVRNLAQRFGAEQLHEDVQKLLVESPDAKCKVLHTVFERGEEKTNTKADRFPIASLYIDVKHQHIIEASGFKEWPVPTGRWSKTSGEMYGRGPGLTALPDIQTVNKADEFGLRRWAQVVQPPILALHDGVIGQPDLRPNRINFVTDIGALAPFTPGGSFDEHAVSREDKRQAIRRIYFMDQIQFLPDRGKTPPTAAEVQARLNIMLQILGPTLSRLEFEFLQPVVNRVFNVLFRAGQLPPMPLEVQQLIQQLGRLDIEFIGPIARARKQSSAAAMDNVIAFTLSLAQVDPGVVDVLDLQEHVRRRSVIEGVDLDLLRSREDVAKRAQQRAEEAQQAAQSEQEAQQAGAVKDLSQAASQE